MTSEIEPSERPSGQSSSSEASASEASASEAAGSEAAGSEQKPVERAPARDSDHLVVVGLGASAGGLEALERLFEDMPSDTGLAFVIVQHLSPDFESMMDELLARHTSMPVRQATDSVRLEPNRIYLIPPRSEMTMSNGLLHLKERAATQGLFLPIDTFFESLAADRGARAIGIVLSGTGSDGSRGVRAIHEAGGLVMVQEEESAQFDGMPRSAVDTGIVDLVLEPAELRDALVRFSRQVRGGELDEEALRLPEDTMAAILDLLRRDSGIDFRNYKPPTVTRRIERRLLLGRLDSLEGYLERLRSDRHELAQLYHDLLIGVTGFFRDRELWSFLSTEVMPKLIDDLEPDEPLRIWVAACATGEEAYSMAIIALDALRAAGRDPLVKVFATDVHRPSLEIAGIGRYPMRAVSGVADRHLERYFQRVRGDVQVSSDLRSKIVFARHDVLRDAPFTRLSLVSCRNLMIYFKPKAQQRAVSLFHYALEVDGVLVLGPSETPGQYADDLEVLERRWKVFRKREDKRLPHAMPPLVAPRAKAEVPSVPLRTDVVDSALRALVERFAPPSLLVNQELELLHTFNGGGRFLAQRDGAASLDVLDMLPSALRLPVATVSRQVADRAKPAHFGRVRDDSVDPPRRVSVSVTPVGAGPRRGSTLHLISFEEVVDAQTPFEQAANNDRRDELDTLDDLARRRIEELEQELEAARESLQATVEEMETSNEELQATNEEMIASNEELQSTNEELQSVNEELYTVNAEHQEKIAELTELTSDMNHLLESTEVHTIFLDRDLCIRKFTPKIAETFHLLPQDVGRRIDSFSHSLRLETLVQDLESVLRGDEPRVEHEVEDLEGRFFFLRILPYRPHEVVDGVVLTLIDISQLHEAKMSLAERESRYRALVRAVSSVLWIADHEGRFVEPQEEWQAYTGQPWSEQQGYGWMDKVHPDDRNTMREAWGVAVHDPNPFEVEGRLWNEEHQRHRHFWMRAVPRVEDGEVHEWVANFEDVHATRRAEELLRQREEQLEAILEHSPTAIYIKDLAGRYLLAGARTVQILGRPTRKVIGATDFDLLPGPVAEILRSHDRRVAELGEPLEIEEDLPVDGEPRTFLTIKFPLRHDGRIVAVAGISSDITERRESIERDRDAIRRRDEFIAMLSHELRNPLSAMLNAHEVLGHPEVDADGRERALAIISRQVAHMARLLDDLLDVTRITRGKIEIRWTTLDLREPARASLEAIQPEVERRGVTVDVDLPDEPLWVRGDAARLLQVQTNLLSNAVKFCADSCRVALRLEAEGGAALIRVADDGVGLSESDKERVFDLFFQRERKVEGGTGGIGVGLSLVKALVTLHGGEVSVASDGHGAGAEFTVRLPLYRPDEEADAAAEEALDEGAKASALSIVLVEDSDDNRVALRTLLEQRGHDVVAVEDGVRGVAAILEHAPDLALVDIGLPGLDGYGVAAQVRDEISRSTRLVALTGYGRPEDREKVLAAGFDEHLVKPLDPSVLRDLLRRCAERDDA